MLYGTLKMWAVSPAILLVFALPTALFWTIAWVHHRRARPAPTVRSRLVVASLVALGALAPPGLSAGLATWGPAPSEVYLIERGGERRLAVVSETSSRRGQSCRVFTWALPERGGGAAWVGGDAASGSCRTEARGVWVTNPTQAPLDLWSGAVGEPLSDALERSGPLPGAGAWQLLVSGPEGATVALQDGSARTVPGVSTEGVGRIGLATESLEQVPPGMYDASEIISNCGCEGAEISCGQLVLHRGVAFGEGGTSLSLLASADDGRSGARVAWTTTLEALFDAEAPVLDVLDDAGACLVLGGRRGGRIAAARIDRGTGAVMDRWIR
jgi:hypothetical protein